MVYNVFIISGLVYGFMSIIIVVCRYFVWSIVYIALYTQYGLLLILYMYILMSYIDLDCRDSRFVHITCSYFIISLSVDGYC